MYQNIQQKLLRSVNAIRKQTDFQPSVALVLGSGLGQYAEQMELVCEIPYDIIPDFPHSTVAGPDGRYLFGYVSGVPVVAMKGRVHYYEGYDISDVVLPIRVMGMLGAKTLVLTNAAGGIDPTFVPGDLMLITDQIASAVPSPLRGSNLAELGERFPDMSEIYDRALCEQIRKTASELGIALRGGVYVQTAGPNYETPAEIRSYRVAGASAVGMSTGCEAIAAKHMGMRICGISCITNMAAGILDQPLNHEEVQEVADRVRHTFQKLVTAVIGQLER